MSRTLYPIYVEPVNTSPETVTESRWHQPFSDPRRRVGLAVALIAASGAVISPWALTQAEAVTESRWHQPLSEPVRVKSLSVAQRQPLAFVAPNQPESVSIDRWLSLLSEPVRTKRAVVFQQPLALVKADPFPEVVSVASWQQPLATSIRVKVRQDTGGTFVAVVSSETVTTDKWYAPLGLPVRVRPSALQLSEPVTPAVGAAIAPNYGWNAPFPTPVWLRSRLHALSPHNFYFLAIANPVPSMATWNEWWVNPVRHLPGLLAANQSDATMPVIPQPNPPVAPGVYTVSGLYVIDQFTDNTVVYDYGGGVSHRTN